MLKNRDKKRQAFKNFLKLIYEGNFFPSTPGGQYYNEKKESDKCDWWQADLSAIILLIYIIFKYIKKRTHTIRFHLVSFQDWTWYCALSFLLT